MAAKKAAYWPTKVLYVANLDLDIKNPRLGGIAASFSPKEIVQYLFRHDKAMEIADSVATRSYFPNEPLLAIRDGNRYTVVEGNRRLAAVMALREPTILEGTAFFGSIKRLAGKLSKNDLNQVPVTIAPDRRATDRQVAGRHVGTQILAWVASNRANFILEKLDEGYTQEELLGELGFSATDIRAARETRAIIQLARAVELPDDIKEKIDNPRTKAVSTIERLFQSLTGRAIIHVDRDEEHGYRIRTSKEEFVPFFQQLLTRIAKREITTRTLNTNELIEEHFKDEWDPSDLPKKRKDSFVPSDLTNPRRKKSAPPTAPPPARQKALHKTVLPKSLKVAYGAPRLRIVRDELTTLDRERKANAGAVLMRVFFELTVVDYLVRTGRMESLEKRLEANNVKWPFEYPEMKHLLKEIMQVARANLRKTEADRVEKALFGNTTQSHVLRDLHAFVHDFAELPTGTDILQFWLRTESLFRLMLESDPSTHK